MTDKKIKKIFFHNISKKTRPKDDLLPDAAFSRSLQAFLSS